MKLCNLCLELTENVTLFEGYTVCKKCGGQVI